MSPNNNSWRLSLLWVDRKRRTQGRFGCELVCVFCCHKTQLVLENGWKRRGQKPEAIVFCISRVLSDVRSGLWQNNTWFVLFICSMMWTCSRYLMHFLPHWCFRFLFFFFCSCCFSFCSSHYPKSKSAENCLCIAEPSWKTNKTFISMLYSLMRKAWFVAIKARTAFNLYCTPV